jgi:hypothetical protein|tara:strand:- start:251 stop:865 length:615 start_codon:yes stop_codon:yes gene_type:complete
MSGSDVISVTITADTVAADDDGISANAAVGNNAALTIGGALASGGSVTLSHGRKVTITSAGDDDEISFTVVGTDVNGDSQTETVTGANAGVATSSNFFLTIASITAVGDPAGNVKAGISADASDVIFAGRARLKGAFLTSTANAGNVDFLTTSPSGTSLMKISSVGSATATRDVIVPEEGVLFTAGIFVQYTVSTFLTLTTFHA